MDPQGKVFSLLVLYRGDSHDGIENAVVVALAGEAYALGDLRDGERALAQILKRAPYAKFVDIFDRRLHHDGAKDTCEMSCREPKLGGEPRNGQRLGIAPFNGFKDGENSLKTACQIGQL